MLEAVHSSQPIMLRLLLSAQREVEMPGQVLVTDPRGLANTQAGESRDLAWTGAFLSCLLTIPQAVRTLRSDRLDGISATTYWIIFGNAAGLGDVVRTQRRIRRRRARARQRTSGVADSSPAASQPAVGRACRSPPGAAM